MIKDLETDWIKLPSAPKMWLSKPIMTNESEFIVAAEKMISTNNKENEGVFCFNTFTNKWSMYFLYPDDVELCIEYPTMAMDKKNNLLYVHSDGNTLLIINTITKSYDIKHNFGSFGSYAPITVLHEKLHLIGGDHNTEHFMWNDAKNKPNKFQSIHKFTDYVTGCENPGFIHIESKNMLLLFGGYDKHRTYYLMKEPYKIFCYKDCIGPLEYIGEWKQYKNMTLPYNIRSFGFAITNDDKYIIINGGINLENKEFQDVIFIMDIEKGVFVKSDICCPVKSLWHSVVMPQNPMDKLLVNGYLRNRNIPKEICDLIVSWYSSQCLHIFKDNGHWKIPVNYL